MKLLDWVSEHFTALVALAAVISSQMNRVKLRRLHIELNSRLTQLLASSGASERAQGILEGRRMGVLESRGRTTENERIEDRADAKREEKK